MTGQPESLDEDGVRKSRVGKVTITPEAWADAQIMAAFREHFEMLSYEWHRGGLERYIATCTSEHFEEVGAGAGVPNYAVVLGKCEGGTVTFEKAVRLQGDGTDHDALAAIEAELGVARAV